METVIGVGSALKSKYDSPEQWVEKIRAGDKHAFELLFRTYSTELHRFLWGYVQCEHTAEGLVQEVFIRVWENRESLTTEGTLKAYLYRIGRNLAIDHLRHRKTVREWEEEKKALHRHSTPGKTINKRIHQKMLLKNVRDAIEALPERRRLIFILSRYNQLTYKEIAQILDISVNTVETQIVRALKLLRKIQSG